MELKPILKRNGLFAFCITTFTNHETRVTIHGGMRSAFFYGHEPGTRDTELEGWIMPAIASLEDLKAAHRVNIF